MTAFAGRLRRGSQRSDWWTSPWAFTLASLLLGAAIQLNFGRLSTGAMLLLTLALAAATLGVYGPRWTAIREPNVMFAIRLALVIQVGLLLVWPPGAASALQDSAALVPYRLALVGAGVVAFSLLVAPARAGRRVAAVVAIYLLAGCWVIALSPNPPNDVWTVHQVAGRALTAGVDPYAINLPNIYGPGSGFYAPSLERGDMLDFGFPYPPLSLLMAIPGVLLGDVRYGLLAASAVSSLVITRIRPGPVANGAAMLLLFTPRTFFIVEQAWTEPFAVMLLAWAVLLASRESRLTPIGIGLLAVVKQYLVLALPFALLFTPRPLRWRRVAGPAVAAIAGAAVVTLPLAMWDVGAFWHSVVIVQLLQPARADALAYPAWLMPQLPQVATWAGFLALAAAAGLAVWRSARTPAGFAGALGLSCLAFFAFNRQAFANYYYFVIGALCVAVAATAARSERATAGQAA